MRPSSSHPEVFFGTLDDRVPLFVDSGAERHGREQRAHDNTKKSRRAPRSWKNWAVQTLEIRHFATLTIRTDPDGLYMLGPTSAGKRIIQELLEVELIGPRVRGRMIGNSGADWLAVADDGEVTLDIRLLIETDDGARVFVHLDGRGELGRTARPGPHLLDGPTRVG